MSLPGRWGWWGRPLFCELSIRETALATLIHQRRLTPSCGGQAPTAERTVGPARMIAESLTPKPGIREQIGTCETCRDEALGLLSRPMRTTNECSLYVRV